MQSNCNLNVIKYCLDANVITIVIDSIQLRVLLTAEKKLPDTKTVFIGKQLATFLKVFFYLLPDGEINKF